MVYNFNSRMIKIPDEYIKKSMKALDLTQDEAIQMYLEDEGFLQNVEQNELQTKAEKSRITATIHGAKAEGEPKERKPRPPKEDATKESVIAQVASFLEGIAENVEIVNKNKLITFKIGEDSFKFDLIRTRNKKKGS